MTKLAYLILTAASPNTSDTFEAAYPDVRRVDEDNYGKFKRPVGKKVYVLGMRFDKGESLTDLDAFGADLKIIIAEDAETRDSLIAYNAAAHQALMPEGVAQDLSLLRGMPDKTYP